MDFSALHTVVSLFAGLFSHVSTYLVVVLAVALVAVYVNLSERLTALQREMHRELRKRPANAFAAGAPSADLDPPPRRPPPGPTSPAREVPQIPEPAGRRSVRESLPQSAPAQTGESHRQARANEQQPAAFIRRFFTSGDWLVRSGIVVLFVGVGLLFKLAADHSLLPTWLRLLGVGSGALVMLALGVRLSASRRGYGLALQGGGFGLLYLTVYAAFALYAVLPPVIGLVLMLLAVATCGWLAHRQGAQVLAVIGALGGFAAPLLASTGAGSHIALFSFYVLLNVGVLGLAFANTWRVLNLTGFVATFVVSALWGATYWNSAYFVSVEPFLLVFFAMYVAIAVAFAVRRSVRLRDPVDSTLVFATPLVAFALQSRLVEHFEFGLAWSAVGLATLYGALAWWLFRRAKTRLTVLGEAFCALSVGFATLSIPLALDANWSSASWALEGAGLLWVGCRQARPIAVYAGAALQFLAAAAWYRSVVLAGDWNSAAWLGTVMIAAAAVLGSLILSRNVSRQRPAESSDDGHVASTLTSTGARALAIVLGVWGLLWWFVGGTIEIEQSVSTNALPGAVLIFLAASAIALEQLATRVRWRLGRFAVNGLPVIVGVVGLAQSVASAHPLSDLAAFAWPLLALTYAWIDRARGSGRSKADHAAHLLMLWIVVAVCTVELGWHVAQWLPDIGSWRRAASSSVPIVALLAIVYTHQRRCWPVAGRETIYLGVGALPLLLWLAATVVTQSVQSPGAPWPIIYLPLLNPLDLSILAAMAVSSAWWRISARTVWSSERSHRLTALAGFGVAFVWLNAMMLRTLHFRTDIPWAFVPLMDSTLVQACLSVLWALTALLVMLVGSRRRLRATWILGVCLMALVLLKLLLVDLSGTGTVARIVSFICVGLSMMMVGWLAPVPPRGEPTCKRSSAQMD